MISSVELAGSALALALSAQAAMAGPCTANEFDKGEYFARQAGKILADRDQGDVNVRTRVFECSYNSYSDEFVLQIGVNWSGSFTGDAYVKEGELIIDDRTNNWQFAESYANTNLRDWRVLRGMIVAGVVVGMALDE